MYTTHFVANGPLFTAYHQAGNGHPLLLVHGYTGSKLDFHDQLEWFADLRRVIAYDQRGHGESSNHQPYNFDVLVQDLMGVLDTLEIERCDLLGHSLGGMVAMRAVLAAPQRFSSLILMDTAAESLPAMPDHVRERLDAQVSEQGCAALLPRMREAQPSAAQQRGIDFLGEEEHWRRIEVKLEQMDPLAFSQLGPLLREQPPLLDRVSGIECPTTVIVGEHDTAFVEPSAVLAQRLPRARLVTIPDAAHCPQYENAEAWQQAVRKHLETHYP
jgi:2-succinyl-6-hydroxy-2,4-cyclohexadiene-1-carboxylate synthase